MSRRSFDDAGIDPVRSWKRVSFRLAGWLQRIGIIPHCGVGSVPGTFEAGQDKLMALCTLHKSGRFGLEYLVKTNGQEIDFRAMGPLGRGQIRGRHLSPYGVQNSGQQSGRKCHIAR